MDKKEITKLITSNQEANGCIFDNFLSLLIEAINQKTSANEIPRDAQFLIEYYGITSKANTLEEIGKKQTVPMTRERVRQIINNAISCYFNNKKESGFYMLCFNIFKTILGDKQYISFTDLCNSKEFSKYKNNPKGLAAFLSDCGICKVSYRKNLYFYIFQKEKTNGTAVLYRKELIKSIQNKRRLFRKNQSAQMIIKKFKTVTYVPETIRGFLLKTAKNDGLMINKLYENIIDKFILYIKSESFKNNEINKIKTWRSRVGKSNWKQIGIYIDNEFYKKIQSCILELESIFRGKISIMGFLYQSFLWFYIKNEK